MSIDQLTPTDSFKYSIVCSLILNLIFFISCGFIIADTTIARENRNKNNSAAASDSSNFNYGFDFSNQEPDPPTQDTDAKYNDSLAVKSALQVLGNFHGCMMDESINGFGAQKNPEPSPGVFDLSSISPRIQMISNAGGVPVITLVQAPSWMYTGCSNPDTNSYDYPTPQFGAAPCPSHYQDFANLAAYIAKSFPNVKYFVVWSEMRGFYNRTTQSIDAAAYTEMYNDVYKAIKAVRPDAMVGGPYAIMSSYTAPHPYTSDSTLHGIWGYIDANAQAALSYWLAHNAGADFIAVDGKTEIAAADSAGITDPLTASKKYAAVDEWIRARSSLPIWWMESHIQPDSGWTDQQAAAARIATLMLMNSSGASVGMQWQPQEQIGWADEGLWTSTKISGGGKPTILANLLIQAMPVLRNRLTLESNEPAGVIVGSNPIGTIFVNTTNDSVTANYSGQNIKLGPGEVITSFTTSVGPIVKTLPDQFALLQNYPNPFNPSTTIKYQIPGSYFVQLKIFDELGREVKTLVNKFQARGNYSITFNASGLSSGVYFYRLKAGGFSETRKLILIK